MSMTDATREQIKKDADQYATVQYGDRDKLGIPEAFTIWDAGQEDFEAGAISQHSISFEAGKIEGARIALEEVERIAERKIATKEMWDLNEKGKCMVAGMESAMQTIFTKLEALKTEIKK